MRRRRAFTLVEALVVISIVGLLFAILLPAIQRVRDAGHQTTCRNKLRQIGIALHNYHDEHRSLPPGCSYLAGKSTNPHMSWCTYVLPYLGETALWKHAERAFEKNSDFLAQPPHIGARVVPHFLCPSETREAFVGRNGSIAGYTHYLGVEGTDQFKKDGLLYLDSQVTWAQVTDGASNTLLVGERPPSADSNLGWWYAGWGQNKDGSAEMILGAREIAVDASFHECLPDANEYGRGKPTNQCDALHFWSLHFHGAHFLFGDGSVRMLLYSVDPILPALATRAGGESVQSPD